MSDVLDGLTDTGYWCLDELDPLEVKTMVENMKILITRCGDDRIKCVCDQLSAQIEKRKNKFK